MDNGQILSLDKSILTLLLSALLLIPTPCLANEANLVASMLGSASPTTRTRGMTILEEQGQDLLPGLVAGLTSGDPSQRRGAAIGLSLMPVPGLTVDGLIQGLRDDDAVVRSLCAHGLGKVGASSAPRIAQLLTHSDNRVQAGAALALSKMGKKAVPALTAMFGLHDPSVTARAAWLLGVMGKDAMAAVPALVRAMETDDMRALHVLAETIDIIGPDPATLYFEMTMLGKGRINCPVTRVGAAAAPTLVKLLARPGTPLANVALYTLARMGASAQPALNVALSTGTPSQKTAAALLITGIDPKLAQTLPEELRQSLAGAMQTQ